MLIKNKSLTIVVPAHNEEKNLADTIGVLLDCIDVWGSVSIVIYNDQSSDKTASIADGFAEKYEFINVIHTEKQLGLGGIFNDSIKNVDSEFFIIIHGQNSITRESLRRIFKYAGAADMIIPYQLNFKERHFGRQFVSKVFTVLVNLLFNNSLKYYNHYVLYHTKHLRRVNIETFSYAYQAEIILNLLWRGHNYIEVGINDNFKSKTKTSAFRVKNVLGVFQFFLRTYSQYLKKAFNQKRNSRLLREDMGVSLPQSIKFPRYLHIETVNNCNADCTMCGIDFSLKSKERIDDVTFKKIIDEVGEYNDHVEKVMLYLDGEPLLDRDIFEKVKYTKSKGVKVVNLATNASLLTESKCHELLESGLDEIYIALDSMDKETYEGIRRGLNYDKVLANIHQLIKLRDKVNSQLKIRIQLIKQSSNITEIDGYIKYWNQFISSHDEISIQKIHNWAGELSHVERYNDTLPCHAKWSTMCIHVDGVVPLCCMDTTTKFPLGDITQRSLKEVWNDQIVNQYRQMHLSGHRNEINICDGCNLWRKDKRELIKA